MCDGGGAQVSCLRLCGCDWIQGDGISRGASCSRVVAIMLCLLNILVAVIIPFDMQWMV